MQSTLIQEFFFEAMQRGWVSCMNKVQISMLPGAKAIVYECGELRLLDFYYSVEDAKESFGATTIWADRKPVWSMHYGGWYEKNVIPFLKRTLAKQYADKAFYGGRGPDRMEGEDHTLQYLNVVEENDFARFSGTERIISTSEIWGVPPGTVLGVHRYFGGLLIPGCCRAEAERP